MTTIRMVTRGLSFAPVIRNLLLVLFCAFVALPAKAQTAAAPPADKLQALMKLMDDPDIRKWVESGAKTDAATATPVVAKADSAEVWEGRARKKIRSAQAGFPILVSEYSAASSRIVAEAQTRGKMPGIVYFTLILLAAAAGEWMLRRFVRAPDNSTLVNTIMRELVAAGAFAAITVALFFVADWPPLLRAALRSYLIAALLFRLVLAVARILLASDSVSPVMYRRTLVFFGVLLFGMATALLTVPLGINPDAVQALAFIVSIALVVICIEAIWKQPAGNPSIRIKALQTVFLVALWVVWAMGFHLLCWFGLMALFLPKVLKSMDHLARAFTAARWPDQPGDNLKAVLIVYGVRTVAIALAIGWLAYIWNSNPLNDNPGSISNTIVTGLLKSVVVLLIADFGWRVCKALIEKKLASVSDDVPLAPEEMARRARIRTLLPIFRNALAAVVLIVTALTVLAELGVEIGPLVAGAGIFGVAIGFGSQTLVKDVISGVFYLMDDAFRVGEYIQSGSYMGTVESFSLRSVRLRHHRGPVFTVPFGELGAVQNMSRDWVIDKFRLRVTFDADIAKAKKLTKVVGAELLADEELGKLIIETVKMKGVEQINEYGVELGFAFTTKPGNQAMVRRRAYAMIRKTFAENGINFAQPTVQVGGDDKPEAAAAAMLKLAEQRKQAEAAAAGGGAT